MSSIAQDETSTARQRPVWRTVLAWTFTVASFIVIWFALVGPDNLANLNVGAFLRIPIEGLVLLTVLVLLPRRARLITTSILGVLLGMLTVIKIIDMGFYEFLNRPFDTGTDWSYFQSAQALLGVSIGQGKAAAFYAGAIALAIAVLLFVPLAALRLTSVAARHRNTTLRTSAAFGVVWLLSLAFGVHLFGSTPIASAGVADLAYRQVAQVNAGLEDNKQLKKAAADDPYRTTSANDLLTGLRGKDVIFTFVESYGQVAVQGSSFSPQVDQVLRSGDTALQQSGFSAESAWLTSPTFGGISWLAHSTLQSGLWINNQQRYNDLVDNTDRTTLSDVFNRAGWRTVADDPSNEKPWPEGKTFYHYDQIYDANNVGYKGPNFSYASMPDQYILSTFEKLELAKPHAPVMAEIDLVSSHTPWAPLPKLVPWTQVGDGSIFQGMPQQGQTPAKVWTKASQVQAAYGQSIQYTLSTLISFVQTYPDPNLVIVVLGDHQPATIVTGQKASHNVPISIIAHDPSVLSSISSWDWQPGLLPSPTAPVWQMSAFRDRFLSAYGTQP
ncbi:MAG TPA: sulfatase [Micromonosporaceae bacterium]